MKFAGVIVTVSDMDRALDFYCNTLGLQTTLRVGDYAELDAGGQKLMLNTHAMREETFGLPSPTPSGKPFEIGFQVDNVDETIESLRRKGVPILKEPANYSWGERIAYIQDPDGTLIGIFQYVNTK